MARIDHTNTEWVPMRAASGERLGPELSAEFCRPFTDAEAERLAAILYDGLRRKWHGSEQCAAPKGEGFHI